MPNNSLKQSAYNCFTRLCWFVLSRKGISALCAYIPSLGGLPPPRSSWSPELRPLCCTAAPHQPPALHVVAYTCQRHPPSSALTRVHGLFSSTVSMLALQVGSSLPFFLSAMFKCHSSFGGGYLGLFFFFVIPYTQRAALLGFQGLKWCFQLPFSLQRRAFVLTIVSSLSLLSSLPSSELQCFFYSYEHFATSSAILLLFSFSNERLLGLLSEFCPASVLHSCDMGELRHF